MAFPDDETDLEVSAEFGANLATPPASLTYPDDITDYVKPYVTIKRGRLSRSATTQPTTIDLGLRNPDGTFSPLNIVGPYYGRLREQTPVRVRLDPGSGMTTRGTGFVPDWPTESTGPGIDDRVAISAAGIMERLSIGQESKSALRRTILAADPAAYWPLEDGSGATSAASPLSGGTPLVASGGVEFGTSFSPVGSAAAVDISALDASLSGPTGIAVGTATSWELDVSVGWDEFHDDGASPMFFGVQTPGSYWGEWGIGIYNTSTSYRIWGYGYALFVGGDDLFDFSGGSETPLELGRTYRVRLVVEQSGGDIEASLYLDGSLIVSDTAPTPATLYAPTEVASPPALSATLNGVIVGQPASVSHAAIWSPAQVSSTTADAHAGYVGEEAAVRFARLCDEEGLDHDVAAGDSQAMGAQLFGQILDLLRECELADEGVMVERLTGELGFDPVATRYNQTPAMTIPYESVQNPFFPDNSVRDAVNRATVTRIGGSSATYERTTGPKGTSKATGIGTYPGDTSRSLNADSDAANHAGWLVNLGTVADPKILATLNLTHNQDLIPSWLACDIGSRIVINPPAQGHESFDAFAQRFGPAALDMILEGYEETLDAIDWLITLHLEPSLPYEAVEIQSGPANTSRIPAAGSVTNAEYGPSVTSLSVTSPSTATRWIDSAAYSSKFPIDIIIAGERMSCTAIVGTTATQTFTVARGSDGVTKTLPSGSEVQVYRPARIPL